MIGRLVRDPEVRTTTNGIKVAEFTIAVNKRSQEGETGMFFRCKAWRQSADYVGNYLSKGRLVAVDGSLEQRKYTDKDGNNREVIEIVADSVQGLDRPRDDAGGGGGNGAPSAAAVNTGGAAPAADEYDPFADE